VSTAPATAGAPAPAAELSLVERDPVVAELRAKGSFAVGLARDLLVNSAESKAEGSELVARARRAIRSAEARRSELVKPHNDHVKAVNALFREVTAPFGEADSIASRKILDYDREERRKAAEAAAEAERKRLEAEALLREAERAEAAGKAEIAEKLLDKAIGDEAIARESQAQARIPARTIPVDAGTVSVRAKPWTYRVVDVALVPREYLMVDHGKVREAIRAGAREIAGLEIFQEEGLAVRA
jgi:hypothetical protein